MKTSKVKVIFYIKIVLGLLLLYYLADYLNPRELWVSFISSNKLKVLISALLIFPLLYLQFFKWRELSGNLLGIKSKKKILDSLLFGISAGLLTPMRLGEFAGRVYILKGTSKSQILVVSLLDKYLTHLYYPVFGIVPLFIFFPEYTTEFIYALLGIIIYWILVIQLLKLRKIKLIINSLRNRFELFDKFVIAVKLVKEMDRKLLTKVLFIAFVYVVLNLLQYAILISAFSMEDKYFTYLFACGFIFWFRSLLPVFTIGDLGVRELTAIYFLSLVGVNEFAAFNASLTIFIFNLVIPSIVSFFVVRGER